MNIQCDKIKPNICKYSVHECSRAGKDGKCKDKEMIKYGCYKYDGKIELSEEVEK